MTKEISAKDCLRFEGESIPHELMIKFCNSNCDYMMVGNSENELAWYDYHAGVWNAGRFIGYAHLKDDATNETYLISILPRFGKAFLDALIFETFNLQLVNSESSLSNSNDWNQFTKYLLFIVWVWKVSSSNRYGLPRKTIKVLHTGNSIRGHLNIQKSIKTLISSSSVVSEYYEKDYNESICKVLFYAYQILINSISNSKLPIILPCTIKDSINQLSHIFRNKRVAVSKSEYENIKYRAIDLSWKPAVDFSWQIINRQNNLLCERTDQSFGLFIDMADLWEQYLRKTLIKHLYNDGWVLSNNEISTYDNKFFKRKIIPDIVLKKENKFLIFDAKYKKMTGRKEDVDRSDFFQIHTYIQYFAENNNVLIGGLLYPISISEPDWEKFHANALFGHKENNTKFIIDGICISIDMNQKQIEENTLRFTERIRNLILT